MDSQYQIYISNFPSRFTIKNLETVFERYGTILSTLIKENQHGVPFAFMVKMSNPILKTPGS